MHSLFTSVDTLDTTTYLHSVLQPNDTFDLQWLMPVTGVENNGQPVELPSYGLYLTIDASGILGQTTPTPIATKFTSINVTLWADPKNDAGTASSTVENGTGFSGNTANHIVLATGTMVSGQMQVDPNTGIRTATDVEKLTPTLDGTILLGGSIKEGDLLTEQFSTQPNEFQMVPLPPDDPSGATSVNLVNGGAATVTLSDPNGYADTFLLPNLPSDFLQHSVLKFIHHKGE
jgi:hypothetical protein